MSTPSRIRPALLASALLLATASVTGLNKAFGIGLRAQWRSVNLSMEYGRHESNPSVFNDNQFFVKGQVQF